MANYQSTHTGAEIDAGIDLLDNNSATQGQVLTANGAGGASWQNASGGGGTLYSHNIKITKIYDNSHSVLIQIEIINNSNTPINSLILLNQYLTNKGFTSDTKLHVASGGAIAGDSNGMMIVSGLKCVSDTLYAEVIKPNGKEAGLYLGTIDSIYDYVTVL